MRKLIEAERLTEIASLDASYGGYEWDEMRVYTKQNSPMFFWHSDSGCSCSYYGMDVYSLDDLSNGTREDALRAVDSYVRAHKGNLGPDVKTRAVLAIKDAKVDQ